MTEFTESPSAGDTGVSQKRVKVDLFVYSSLASPQHLFVYSSSACTFFCHLASVPCLRCWPSCSTVVWCRSEEKEGCQHSIEHRVKSKSQRVLYPHRSGAGGHSRRTSASGLSFQFSRWYIRIYSVTYLHFFCSKLCHCSELSVAFVQRKFGSLISYCLA